MAAMVCCRPQPPVEQVATPALGSVRRVSVTGARAWEKVVWLDARAAEEFEADHVPGALPLRESHWESDFPGVLDAWQPDSKVVIYCGQRCDASEDAARRLVRDTEWTEVFVLEGGWEAWKQAVAN